MELLYHIDFKILNWIQEALHNNLFDSFFPFLTKLGDGGMIWIVTGIILLCFKKYRKIGVFLLLGLAFGFLIGECTMKPLIGRVRPFIENENINLLISPPSGYSFPSGHSWSSFTAGTFLLLNNKKWGLPAFGLAVLIAFSRLYLYVHFPSDVIAGALFGIGTAFLAKFCMDKWNKRHSQTPLDH